MRASTYRSTGVSPNAVNLILIVSPRRGAPYKRGWRKTRPPEKMVSLVTPFQRRPRMATFSSGLRHVKDNLEQCLPRDFIFKTCRQIGHTWRNCTLNPAVSVHVLLLQLLAQVALRGVDRVAHVKKTFQAIGKARGRLPLKLFERLVQQT